MIAIIVLLRFGRHEDDIFNSWCKKKTHVAAGLVQHVVAKTSVIGCFVSLVGLGFKLKGMLVGTVGWTL